MSLGLEARAIGMADAYGLPRPGPLAQDARAAPGRSGRCGMLIVSVSLMTLWMVCALLGFTLFGFTHLLFISAIAIEVMRHHEKRI